jgi:hypothetical protein
MVKCNIIIIWLINNIVKIVSAVPELLTLSIEKDVACAKLIYRLNGFKA